MGKKKNEKESTENGQAEAAEQEVLEQENVEAGELSEENETEESDDSSELQEMKDKYIRLLAEFENYKKRTFKEKLDTINTASRDTMLAILPVLDDFDRAKQVSEDESTTESFTEGVELVYQKLHSTLKAKGLVAMESTGQPFDSELHEALTEIPAPSEAEKGLIIDTIEKGYTLNDTIIRHAKVVVGK